MKNMKSDYLKTPLPDTLSKRIKKIEHHLDSSNTGEPIRKIAVFDMDNTLLEGDIGDALFVQLRLDGNPIPLTWAEYDRLIIEKGKKIAYSTVITAMAGIPVETVKETTHRVLRTPAAFLEIEGIRVPVPRPNPIMKVLVSYLEELNYTIYIISATNSISVKVTIEEFFNIPDTHAIGMQPSVIDDEKLGPVIGNTIDGPITVNDGKVEAYRQAIGSFPPYISGGDSASDYEMLNLTHPDGLILWAGNDDNKFETLKQHLDFPQNAYFLRRN
jgi:phosphoserine phosphatase